MTSGPGLTPLPEVDELLREFLARVRTVLAPRLVGVYLDGSLATGDFEPDRSDIDLAVVTAAPLGAGSIALLAAMHRTLAGRSARWGLEIEGSYVSRAWLRRYQPRLPEHPHIERGSCRLYTVQHETGYWTIHRHVLREHGVILHGPPPRSFIDPGPAAELQRAAAGVLGQWWTWVLRDQAVLANGFYRCYAVLTTCRMLYTLEMAAITSKRHAAAWARERLDRRWHPLIDRALAWSRSAPPSLADTNALIRYTCARAS